MPLKGWRGWSRGSDQKPLIQSACPATRKGERTPLGEEERDQSLKDNFCTISAEKEAVLPNAPSKT